MQRCKALSSPVSLCGQWLTLMDLPLLILAPNCCCLPAQLPAGAASPCLFSQGTSKCQEKCRGSGIRSWEAGDKSALLQPAREGRRRG